MRTKFYIIKTVIDKFHIIKHANEAVDRIGRAESKTNSELKGGKIPLAKKWEESDGEAEGKKRKPYESSSQDRKDHDDA